MNEKMFTHQLTQENIARLKKIGYRFIGPKKGRLVCGDVGLGHLASVEEIVREALKLLR
jgi:phosphopantothenoylcysteine synthetase/decarboxylase